MSTVFSIFRFRLQMQNRTTQSTSPLFHMEVEVHLALLVLATRHLIQWQLFVLEVVQDQILQQMFLLHFFTSILGKERRFALNRCSISGWKVPWSFLPMPGKLIDNPWWSGWMPIFGLSRRSIVLYSISFDERSFLRWLVNQVSIRRWESRYSISFMMTINFFWCQRSIERDTHSTVSLSCCMFERLRFLQ